jgi:hypothetical protein
MGKKKNAYRYFMGNPERKRPLGSPCHGVIKTSFKEIGCAATDWIHLTQVETSCGDGNEPSGSIKYWGTLE